MTLKKRFQARHHFYASFFPCKRQTKVFGKNNRGKGIACVLLGVSPIELIPGKKAWHGGWIWPHETLRPPSFCSFGWMLPVIALVADCRRPLPLLSRVIVPSHRAPRFQLPAGRRMVWMERGASVVEAREAVGSWDRASQIDAKLLLEAKSSIFQMLKLCDVQMAGMSPPPDAGRPPGEGPTGLSSSPPTQTYWGCRLSPFCLGLCHS